MRIGVIHQYAGTLGADINIGLLHEPGWIIASVARDSDLAVGNIEYLFWSPSESVKAIELYVDAVAD